MVKIAKKGHKYILVNQEQMTQKLHGLGICDFCCSTILNNGYLVPVLNSVYCKKCFSRWQQNARTKHYAEDENYELRKTEYFIKILT